MSDADNITRLATILAQHQIAWEDTEIDIHDVMVIDQLATQFGVPQRHAYWRARELGLLSYQANRPAGAGE